MKAIITTTLLALSSWAVMSCFPSAARSALPQSILEEIEVSPAPSSRLKDLIEDYLQAYREDVIQSASSAAELVGRTSEIAEVVFSPQELAHYSQNLKLIDSYFEGDPGAIVDLGFSLEQFWEQAYLNSYFFENFSEFKKIKEVQWFWFSLGTGILTGSVGNSIEKTAVKGIRVKAFLQKSFLVETARTYASIGLLSLVSNAKPESVQRTQARILPPPVLYLRGVTGLGDDPASYNLDTAKINEQIQFNGKVLGLLASSPVDALLWARVISGLKTAAKAMGKVISAAEWGALINAATAAERMAAIRAIGLALAHASKTEQLMAALVGIVSVDALFAIAIAMTVGVLTDQLSQDYQFSKQLDLLLKNTQDAVGPFMSAARTQNLAWQVESASKLVNSAQKTVQLRNRYLLEILFKKRTDERASLSYLNGLARSIDPAVVTYFAREHLQNLNLDPLDADQKTLLLQKISVMPEPFKKEAQTIVQSYLLTRSMDLPYVASSPKAPMAISDFAQHLNEGNLATQDVLVMELRSGHASKTPERLQLQVLSLIQFQSQKYGMKYVRVYADLTLKNQLQRYIGLLTKYHSSNLAPSNLVPNDQGESMGGRFSLFEFLGANHAQ